jgi:uncharacterized protein (TIGR02001 family)
MKKVLLATLLATSTLAVAEDQIAVEQIADAQESGGLSAYVTGTSEYIWRGLKQSQGDAAVQGGIDYDFDNGFYVGTWASTIKWTEDGNYMNDSDFETNFFGGYASEFGDTGIGYDVGLLQYYFPGNKKSGVADVDATEAYIGLNTGIAHTNLAIKYSHVLSDDAWGISDAKGSQYYEANWTIPVTDTVAVLSHVGRSEFDGTGNGDLDYTDWSIGAEYAWNENLTLGAAWTDTNADGALWTIDGEKQGDGQAVAYATWAF